VDYLETSTALPRLAVLSVLSAASSPCPDLNLIHYIARLLLYGMNVNTRCFQTTLSDGYTKLLTFIKQ